MSFDRGVGTAAAVVAAAVVFVGVAVSGSSRLPAHDRAAARELVALLRAQRTGNWLVEFDVVRTSHDGRSTRSVVVEARSGTLHVVRGATVATVARGAVAYDCTIVGDGVECLARTAGGKLPDATVVHTLVTERAYVVVAIPRETIAGEPARCFRLAAARGFLAEVGLEVEHCFGADGVPLRTRRVGVTTTDERVARRAERDPPASALEALVAGFGPAAPAAAR